MYQDKLTSMQTVMDSDHSYIHEEKGYSVSTDTGSVAAAGNYKFHLKTPALPHFIHARPTKFAASANIMKMTIYEDSTVTGGALVYANNHFRGNDKPYPPFTLKKGVTAALTGKNLITPVAGGNFDNQPNNGGVEIISDNNADKGMIVTLYGTIHGATTAVISEQLVLKGTTQVVSTHTDWSAILGVEMDSVAAGTVTIREASTNQTITSLATTVLSAGVATITESKCRDRKIVIDADGASTKIVGVIGTDYNDAVITAAAALTGDTEKDLSALLFRTATKILIGDVASTTKVTVKREEVSLYSLVVGAGGQPQSRAGGSAGASEEFVLEPDTDYVISVDNIGATTASTGYLNLFFYDEPYIGLP